MTSSVYENCVKLTKTVSGFQISGWHIYDIHNLCYEVAYHNPEAFSVFVLFLTYLNKHNWYCLNFVILLHVWLWYILNLNAYIYIYLLRWCVIIIYTLHQTEVMNIENNNGGMCFIFLSLISPNKQAIVAKCVFLKQCFMRKCVFAHSNLCMFGLISYLVYFLLLFFLVDRITVHVFRVSTGAIVVLANYVVMGIRIFVKMAELASKCINIL